VLAVSRIERVEDRMLVSYALRRDDGAVDPSVRSAMIVDDGSLAVVARGAVFDLSAQVGEATALGMGISDPESADALLVSWWTGEQKPAGIVKYTITRQAQDGIIDATYTPVMAESSGHHDVLPGRAVGDTRRGFPGTYSILYQGVGDTTFGPFDWTITPHGDLFTLTWEVQGQLAIRGFGFTDPDRPASIIVNYWGSSE
jgi:hypothetical protein